MIHARFAAEGLQERQKADPGGDRRDHGQRALLVNDGVYCP
jgi:hypothetical protein